MKNIIRCRGGKFVWEKGERKRGSTKSAPYLDLYDCLIFHTCFDVYNTVTLEFKLRKRCLRNL